MSIQEKLKRRYNKTQRWAKGEEVRFKKYKIAKLPRMKIDMKCDECSSVVARHVMMPRTVCFECRRKKMCIYNKMYRAGFGGRKKKA